MQLDSINYSFSIKYLIATETMKILNAGSWNLSLRRKRKEMRIIFFPRRKRLSVNNVIKIRNI